MVDNWQNHWTTTIIRIEMEMVIDMYSDQLTCFPCLFKKPICHYWVVLAKPAFVRRRIIYDSTPGLHDWETQHIHTNKNTHRHHLVTTLFSSHLKWEHALGRTGRMEVGDRKRKKKKRRTGMGIKWEKPKGRTLSDKRPNQEREREGGGEKDRQQEREQDRNDQPGGSGVW